MKKQKIPVSLHSADNPFEKSKKKCSVKEIELPEKKFLHCK
jgi:hypothetical protein